MKKSIAYLVSACLSFVCASCSSSSDDGPKLLMKSQTELQMHYEDTYQIEAEASAPITYTSQRLFVATVNDNGQIKAGHVGETNVIVEADGEAKFVKVKVTPVYNQFQIPCIEWGLGRQKVIDKYGTPDGSTSETISYKSPSPMVASSIYQFDESGRLVTSAMVVKYDYAYTLTKFLLERYQTVLVDDESDSVYLADDIEEDKVTTFVLLSMSSSSYVMVIFMDYKDLKQSTTKALPIDGAACMQNLVEALGIVVGK